MYPTIFYYQQKSSQAVFSSSPPGEIDIPKFIKGKPCWKRGQPLSEPKQKTLIFADWTAIAWPVWHRIKVRDCLISLLDEGFPLYCWQDGEVVPFTAALISRLDSDYKGFTKPYFKPYFAKRMTSVSAGKIVSLASKQLHLPKDQLHVLDDYWIETLLNGNVPGQLRSIDMGVFFKRFEERLNDDQLLDDTDELIAMLQQAYPPVEVIVSSIFPEPEGLRDTLQEAFPKAIVVEKLKDVRLEDHEQLNTVFEQQNNLITALDLQAVESVKFQVEGDIVYSDLPLLAKTFVNLKRMSICLDKSQCEKFPNDFTALFKLEELVIYGLDIVNGYLAVLLGSTLELKSLNIIFSSKQSALCFEIFQLQKLEHLSITNALRIRPKDIRSLLINSPLLKTFIIGNCKNLYFINDIVLKQLQILQVNRCSLNMGNLFEFLRDKSELTTLSIEDCIVSQEGYLGLVSPVLSSLEAISILFTDMHEDALDILIAASPKLKSLAIANKKMPFSTSFYPSSKNLKSLAVRDCSAVNISCLMNLPFIDNLDQLDLSGSKLVFDDYSEIILPLEVLKLGGTNINNEQLKQWLKTLPLLKRLDLYGCFDIDITSDRELQELLENIAQLQLPFITFFNDDSASKFTDSEDEQMECVHDLRHFKDHRPTPEAQSFKFEGKNKTFNQNMIIEKLSQYLTIKNKQLAVIPQIQEGICKALSIQFIQCSLKEWQKFIEKINRWDGRRASLTVTLEETFEALFQTVQEFQLKKGEPGSFLGGSAEDFLKQNRRALEKGCVLTNPWHAIAVKYISESAEWCIYDPNFRECILFCSEDNLLTLLHRSLGMLISVYDWKEKLPVLKPLEASHFIAEGGLLTLNKVCNLANILVNFPKIKHLDHYKWSTKAFDGLFLRTISGKPAWVVSLNHSQVRAYALSLLRQIIQENPTNACQQIAHSMEVLKPAQKQEILRTLIQDAKPDDIIITTVTKAMSKASNQIYYTSRLATWHKDKAGPETLSAYCQKLISEGSRNRKQLIELNGLTSVMALQMGLQSFCILNSIPVFYIDHPDDLVCSASYVKLLKNHQGQLKKGPGGLLHDFLEMAQDKSDPAPVLIINYAQFKADDIVRMNSLLNDHRSADGTPLPEALQLIGLSDYEAVDYYQGEDFYSRFDVIERCPLSQKELDDSINPLPLREFNEVVIDTDPPLLISLYNDTNWKDRLLGHWTLKDNQLVFEEGALVKALKMIKPGQDILIENGLWDELGFQQFWHHAFLRGYIEFEGQRINWPKDQQLIRKEGYAWPQLSGQLNFCTGLKPDARVLNPFTLTDFFNRYHCDNEQETLNSLPGWIEAQAGETFHVNVTRDLSRDEWAMLLDACRNWQVSLRCHVYPDYVIPDCLQEAQWSDAAEEKIQDEVTAPAAVLLISSDTDITQRKLIKLNKVWKIIEISECSASDLLASIHGTVDNDSSSFSFRQKASSLQNLLEAEEAVILKGNFSTELMDALAPLLLERLAYPERCKGELYLLTQDEKAFAYLAYDEDRPSLNDKACCLTEDGFTEREISALEAAFFEKESLSRCKAALQYLRRHSDEPLEKCWQGLITPLDSLSTLQTIKLEHSQQITDAFTKQRLEAVNQALQDAPYVFLSGLTGVGKSTFVEKEMAAQSGNRLFLGEERIKAWAEDNSDHLKILFIDEANLSPRQWSEFEGLFNQPPAIFLDGEYYSLSENHKVIFAGNPMSYGDERQLAELFIRHGNAVVFEPMPAEFIYETIIKPVFQNSRWEKALLEIVPPLLNVYDFLCRCSDQEVLITPREIQMMALFIVSNSEDLSLKEVQALAEYYAWLLAKSLVPEEKSLEFDRWFNKKDRSVVYPASVATPLGAEFLITPSRQELYHQLRAWLHLRDFKQLENTNEAQAYGGLGGLVIEGEPGIGKSDLVVHTLLAAGYTEVSMTKNPILSDKIFYQMPVSMELDAKIALLMKAFNEAAVVIVDEINSSPMMERLLNHLLMGKSPDGRRPDKPGFMIIGTQNPVTMSGRGLASKAWLHRVTTVFLPQYPDDEILETLQHIGIDKDDALEMREAYNTQRQRAEKENLTALPTFRDLLRLAKQQLKWYQSQPQLPSVASGKMENESDEVFDLAAVQWGRDFNGLIALLEDYLSAYNLSPSSRLFHPYSYSKTKVIQILRDINADHYQTVQEACEDLLAISCPAADPFVEYQALIEDKLMTVQRKFCNIA